MRRWRNRLLATAIPAGVALAASGCVGTPGSCRGFTPAELAVGGDAGPENNGRVPGRLQCLADRGDGSAAVALGRRYELGIGVVRDAPRAARLYAAAAAVVPETTAIYAPPVRHGGRGQVLLLRNPRAGPGLAAAQYRLGMMYLDGRGVARDPDRARMLIGRAAAQGFPDAIDMLRQLSP